MKKKQIFKTGFMSYWEKFIDTNYTEKFIYLIVLFATIDVITTIIGLNLGFIEQNNRVNYFLNFGFYYALGYIIICKVALILFAEYGRKADKLPKIMIFNASLVALLLTFLACINNVYYIGSV